MKPPVPKSTLSPLPQPAPHADPVRGSDGRPYWKLTCFCGKIMLAPGDGSRAHGLCPKCGKPLLFPTERSISGLLPVIPANKPRRNKLLKKRPAARKPSGTSDRSTRDRDSSKDRIHLGQSASDNAADKLRPNNARSSHASKGLVTAWPAADMLPRILATFIDFTVIVALVAGLLLAGPYLPTHFSSITFRVAFALFALWLNEGVLQWLWHGSLGKKLCLIVLREEGGESLRTENALLRPFVKWVFLPAWPLVFRDPNGQALHDRLLNVVVLKGRAQK